MGNLGDLSPQGSVAVGVIVGLISTSLQAIGLTLQRKSHILEDEKHPYDLRRPPYKRRRWQLGMLMFVVSNIVGSTIQITTLPLPVLSTLQASGLVFNTIFATLVLGEAFTRYSFIGTILVCIGAVLIAVFGAIATQFRTLDGGDSRHCAGHSARLKIAQASRLSAPLKAYKYWTYLDSAYTNVPEPSKSAVELLVRTIVDRVNQFNRWQSWVILLAMITLALTQLYFLHRGLKLCSTSILYPFVFCIYNIIAILDSLIYFRQLSQLAGFHAGLIALGTVVLLSGVLCLSWRLEVIDSHASVTVVGPSQTGLGPGMAVFEENPHSPREVGGEDEELRIGERQPLLQASHPPHGSPHRRTPSLPLVSSIPQQTPTAGIDPASIWAELDDSDYEYTGTGPLWQPRPRSSTLRESVLQAPAQCTKDTTSEELQSPAPTIDNLSKNEAPTLGLSQVTTQVAPSATAHRVRASANVDMKDRITSSHQVAVANHSNSPPLHPATAPLQAQETP
ncbi:hypothetical protein CNMCM8980_008742 [Aspergillus fumigatiaffinis]|uniref:DUF803 domain-containing protein n=1 Tax=Aspergillus fumigatiaffinis TaxID=340414 RepID=A0A8H4M209_9EURO|nr:hypothetical protein CNMCM5878_008395 [Aspergillus fumigatiaffinis]KAF4225537.1 hypothetical protein CNMCM6457_008064 [Aspergillus fumigatiaffinis]KAF4234583.1 hypothetical protein CNMCM6805_008558 [Aspergillus fumigatiaffinis]KAF4246338.1 hypothetical protein CNMCM8980_008742 [Aspergillus fumigatiaffinis]